MTPPELLGRLAVAGLVAFAAAFAAAYAVCAVATLIARRRKGVRPLP